MIRNMIIPVVNIVDYNVVVPEYESKLLDLSDGYDYLRRISVLGEVSLQSKTFSKYLSYLIVSLMLIHCVQSIHASPYNYIVF